MPRRERARRLEHSHLHLHGTTHRRHSAHPSSRSHGKHHAHLVEPSSNSSASFDILRVEPTTTFVDPQTTSDILETTIESAEQTTTSTGATLAPEETSKTSSVRPSPSTTLYPVIQVSTSKEPIQLQVDPSTSFERTTLVVSPTFSIVSVPSSISSPSSTFLFINANGAPSSSWTLARATTLTRPIPSMVHTASPSASANPASHSSHPHISPALVVFMVFGGVASLGLSIYVFKRMRYKALHVSRSQFQITTNGSGAVPGSSSENSFVSGGVGRRQAGKYEKNGYLDPNVETPLWGGKEEFSPLIGAGVVDYPPAAHLADSSRAPMRHRQSMLQTIRRYTPGARFSRSEPGHSTLQGHQEPCAVPTFKITDTDIRHNRLDSGSTFSSGVDGSPDPNLATIQVASVTRNLSVAASYRVGSPSPPPAVIAGMDHPRPAPKVPAKALVLDRAPPVPSIPAVTVTPSELGGKKLLDASCRGKIDVKDISKPQPLHVAPVVDPAYAIGEGDPMVMYAKYSAGLGVGEGCPEQESVRQESSMAKKIAQIAQSKSAMITTESHASLSNRDTRALAAAAGVGSPIPGEDHTFRGFHKTQPTVNAPQLETTLTPVSRSPVSPGLGEVGNMMLRPFGEAGSMLPVFLETPAIGLDGRSSYLSISAGAGSNSTTGPPAAISNKAISAMLETDNSTGTLSPSMVSDDPSRRTIASAYSQDWASLSQGVHMRQNPDYKSPTYSIYNYYGPDRVSTAPRMPSMVYGDREESQIGGAL